MTVGEKIADHLQSNGISQAHVARVTGMSLSKINLLLHGRRRITIDDYICICDALHVPVDVFLEPRTKT